MSIDPKNFPDMSQAINKGLEIAGNAGKSIKNFFLNTLPKAAAPVIKTGMEAKDRGIEAANRAWGIAIPAINKTVGPLYNSILETILKEMQERERLIGKKEKRSDEGLPKDYNHNNQNLTQKDWESQMKNLNDPPPKSIYE